MWRSPDGPPPSPAAPWPAAIRVWPVLTPTGMAISMARFSGFPPSPPQSVQGSSESYALPRQAELRARFDPDLLGGTTVVEADGWRCEPSREAPLYALDPPVTVPARLRAVPYSLWGNRGPGEMLVWIRE